MNVEWTDAAERQLHAIHAHHARTSRNYADALVARITQRTWQIGQFPNSGALYLTASPLEIRYVLEGSYRLMYIVAKDEVHVIGVVQTSRRLF